jgi:hypothetical protein
MALTKEQRQSVAKAQRITEVIGEKLKENSANTKVDLTNLAKDLSKRKQAAETNDE